MLDHGMDELLLMFTRLCVEVPSALDSKSSLQVTTIGIQIFKLGSDSAALPLQNSHYLSVQLP